MIKQTLYFGNPAHLYKRNEQLCIAMNKQNETEDETKVITKPIEDIGIVVLDNPQITLTQALIESLLSNNVVLITCDSSHQPTGLLMPLSGNTIQNERFRAQLDATEPLKKQVWAQTIVQKIKNQQAVLDTLKLENDYLTPLHKNVKSGDITNCEATATAFYWQRLFAHIPGFTRQREGIPPNNYLNYGYALLRATMARSIVGAGLLPTLGIHHHNRYNAYCLADDLMEPYRPYVDTVVYSVLKEHGTSEDISKEIKAILLKIPAMDVVLENEKSPLMNATQRTAVSLVKCFTGEQRKILYPDMT